MLKRPLCLLFVPLSAGFILVSAVSVSTDGAKSIELSELPPFTLTNFGYTQSELDAAAPNGLIDDDNPAIGSGLVHLQGVSYLGITDRGPNIDHFPVDDRCQPTSSSANGKTFPLPQFTPALVKFQTVGAAIAITGIVNLVTPLGNPITGLANDADDDPPFDDPCSNSPIAVNENGMDIEDLAPLPGARILGVEENKPSLFVASIATGAVTHRYTPAGKPLSGTEYTVADLLPAVLRTRRLNRGFESIAVSPDGGTAYTATQSPLGSTNATRLIRILRLNVTDPSNPSVDGEFVWIMSPASVYPQTSAGAPLSTRQQDLKLSAMAWVGPNQLLLLERSDRAGAGGIRLILIDLSDATNILGQYDGTAIDPSSGLALEAFNTSLPATIVPAASTVVFEEYEFPAANQLFTTYKLEGLAVLNANQVAIINDNDFGIDPANPHVPTRLWKLRLTTQLPLAK